MRAHVALVLVACVQLGTSISKVAFNATFNQLNYQSCSEAICSIVCEDMKGKEALCGKTAFGFGVYPLYTKVCCAAAQDGAIMNDNRVDFTLVRGVTAFGGGLQNGVESYKYDYTTGTGMGFLFQKRGTHPYPIFTKEPIGKTFEDSPDITLECEAVTAGNAEVVLSWFKDGAPIPGETDTQLIVEDAGSYHCRATVSGCSIRSGEITIAGSPGSLTYLPPPSLPSTNLLTSRAVSSSSLSDTVAQLRSQCGGTVYKDGYTEFTPAYGSYQCMEQGLVKQTTSLILPSTPLRITGTAFTSTTVQELEQLTLGCNTTGYPETLLKWSQNGGSVTSDLLWRGAGEVMIERVVMEDAGVYRCGVPETEKWGDPMTVNVRVRNRIVSFKRNALKYMVRDTIILTLVYQVDGDANCAPKVKLGERLLEEGPSVTIEHAKLLDIGTAKRHKYSVALSDVTLSDQGTVKGMLWLDGSVIDTFVELIGVYNRPTVTAGLITHEGLTGRILHCNYSKVDFLESFDNDLQHSVEEKKTGKFLFTETESYDPETELTSFSYSHNLTKPGTYRCRGHYTETGYTFYSEWVSSASGLSVGPCVLFILLLIELI